MTFHDREISFQGSSFLLFLFKDLVYFILNAALFIFCKCNKHTVFMTLSSKQSNNTRFDILYRTKSATSELILYFNSTISHEKDFVEKNTVNNQFSLVKLHLKVSSIGIILLNGRSVECLAYCYMFIDRQYHTTKHIFYMSCKDK